MTGYEMKFCPEHNCQYEDYYEQCESLQGKRDGNMMYEDEYEGIKNDL